MIVIDNTPPVAHLSHTNENIKGSLPLVLSGVDAVGISTMIYTIDGTTPSFTNGTHLSDGGTYNITSSGAYNIQAIRVVATRPPLPLVVPADRN